MASRYSFQLHSTILFAISLLLLNGILSNSRAGGTGIGDGKQQDAAYTDAFAPGDGLRISNYADTSSFLNGIYPVDSDGNVFLPIIGSVHVVSYNPKEFTQYLQKTYEQYVRYPEIQVQPLIRVSVLGGFAEPGLYYVEPQRSMWDVIHLAGGTVHAKGLQRIRWERGKNEVSKDVIPYLESGQSLHQIGFKSGDQLWTPSEKDNSFWTNVVRDVIIRDILPLATFTLSLYVSLETLNRNNR